MTVKLKYKGEDCEYEVGGVSDNSRDNADQIAIDCMARNLNINSKLNIPLGIIKSNLFVVSAN